MELKIKLSENLKSKPADENNLGFGKLFTDHMLVIDYEKGKGWYNAEIVPFGNLSLSPASMCLHYGQEVFEGLKAYRTAEDEILLFRPEENYKRLNKSNNRLVIPPINEEFALYALKELIKIEKDWVPHSDGASLYIRPFIFAVDDFLGVAPASRYKFITILSPSGAYYASGLDPVGIYVESSYVRAVKGGTGFAKTAGNYASSLIAQDEAHNSGFSQVLWLDGVEKKYVEEVGAMNIFFVIDGEIVTPQLEGSVLPGITRKSAIDLCKSWGMKVTERKVAIQEIADAYDSGKLTEVFGTGTAAVISPVGLLKWNDKEMKINNNQIGEVSQRLYDTLTGIQYGKIPDTFGFMVKVC
ncbi:MAG: branched-chain amino acid aminotransferase [Ruminococcus sp.]|jgi:branched-chain amino acid aminotransferase|nr:branched-chain amino acid aminotransferase [Ruminococcus sp.]